MLRARFREARQRDLGEEGAFILSKLGRGGGRGMVENHPKTARAPAIFQYLSTMLENVAIIAEAVCGLERQIPTAEKVTWNS